MISPESPHRESPVRSQCLINTPQQCNPTPLSPAAVMLTPNSQVLTAPLVLKSPRSHYPWQSSLPWNNASLCVFRNCLSYAVKPRKCFRVIPTIHFCLEKSSAVVCLREVGSTIPAERLIKMKGGVDEHLACSQVIVQQRKTWARSAATSPSSCYLRFRV